MSSSQVLYDPFTPSSPPPRSASAGSKIDNLRGMSNKIFGSRKGAMSAGNMSSDESLISTVSAEERQSTLAPLQSSTPTSLFFKAPHTPPGSSVTSSPSTFSPVSTYHSSITSPGGSSQRSTCKSTHSGEDNQSSDFSDCCYCDIPLKYVLGAEDIVELRCSHLAHFECLVQLSEVLNKNPRATHKHRLPPCGICDEPGSITDASHQEKLNKVMSDRMSLRISPPSSPADSSPGSTPLTSPVENKHSNVPFKECLCDSDGCKGTSSSIQFFSQLDGQQVPSSGPATIECLVGVSVSGNKFYNNSYVPPLNQDVKLLHQISKLKRLFFKGVSMERLDMNRLRFAANLKVSSDRCTWSNCTLYLFAGHIVLTAKGPDGQPQIKSVIDIKLHLTSAKILGRERKPHIEIVAKTIQRYKVYLVCDKVDVLEALCAALHNDQLNFPITTQVNDTYSMVVPEHTGEVIHRTPLDIVLCVEQPSTTEQADAIVQSLVALRATMTTMDRLAVIIYGSMTRSFSFQSATWSSWYKVDDALLKVGKPFQAVSLDESLAAAEELLQNLRVERSLACVIVLSSSEKVNLTSISTGFVYSDTSIHTIGIDDKFDPVALSTLAAKTDGLFYSCASSKLLEKVVQLYHHTKSRTHKNVEIKLAPPPGVKISKVEGCKLPFFDHIEGSSTGPVDSPGSEMMYSVKTDPGMNYSVPFGSLYENSFKSIVVTIDIEDCSLLDGGPILDMTLYSRPPQSISHHRCTFTNYLYPDDTVSNGELMKYQASLDACSFAQELCSLLANGQHKVAFQQTQTTRAKFASRYTAKDTNMNGECRDSLNGLLEYYDRFFDEFSDKLFQPHAVLTGELLNFMWKHSCKNPNYFN